ncbi:hypothetical protein [Tenacibaculum xiamenense]|uniref:hypothetical protein n=1 Tax=Tenacibaculum xiamenense TaxID=1261553 RepID=UPI0038B4EA71
MFNKFKEVKLNNNDLYNNLMEKASGKFSGYDKFSAVIKEVNREMNTDFNFQMSLSEISILMTTLIMTRL